MMTAIKPDAERMALLNRADAFLNKNAVDETGACALICELAAALRSSAGPATREATIEECALLVQTNQETFSETHDGSRRHLKPRKNGNLAGLAYADGIRALSLQQEQQPDKGEPVACNDPVHKFTFDPTNHHNALKCPYCNPQGLTFANPAPAAEVREVSEQELREWLNEQPYKTSTLAERLLSTYRVLKPEQPR